MADDFAGIPPPGSVPDPTPPRSAPDPAPTVASTGRTQDLSPDAEGPAEPAHRDSPGMGPETGDPAQYQKVLDYFSGKGAMPPEQFEGLKGEAAKPDEQLSPTELNMRILDMAAQAGPEAALGAVQSMRSQYEPRRAQAARAAEAGHLDVAAKEATDAFGHVPDDHEVTFAPGRGGVVAVVNSPTGDTHKFDLPGNQFTEALKSPQTIWDHVVDNGAAKVLGQFAPSQGKALAGRDETSSKELDPITGVSQDDVGRGGLSSIPRGVGNVGLAAIQAGNPSQQEGQETRIKRFGEQDEPKPDAGTPAAGAPATTGTAAAAPAPGTAAAPGEPPAGRLEELRDKAQPEPRAQYPNKASSEWEKRYDSQADKWGTYNTKSHQWQPQENEAAAGARAATLNKATDAGQMRPEQKIVAIHAGGQTKYYMLNNTINGIPMGSYEVSPQQARTMHETGGGTKHVVASGDKNNHEMSESSTHYSDKREDVIPTMSRDPTPDPNTHLGQGGAGAATEEAKAVRQTQHDIYGALLKQTEPLTPRQQDFMRQYEQSGQASFKQPLQPPGPMTGLKPGSGRKFPDGSVWTLDPNGKPYRYQ